MAYQSLYRRYRSGKFSELVGQAHVVAALKNAITEDRVGHAYLFSGPRGTGKTSTARILGKALNCTNLGDDGEPCGVCDSCVSFESGTSYDLQELDAASNNGVEAIRDLISKVALGSPGRTKVYILDEVHMLTSGAENALLKTLEEPPEHVVFVLATTEPHKVVPTIRSRTQHFEFELIAANELEQHVRWVAQDAQLDVTDEMIDHVLRVGGGSARDTLSALDQVVAAGGVPRDEDAIDAVLQGLASSDPAAVVAAVSEALTAGRDPRVIGETLLGRLRDAFLSAMGAPTNHLSDTQAQAAQAVAAQMRPAAITRSLETLGSALIDMRQAPDPRVDLEVALLRLVRADLDTDPAALLARIEALEAGAVAAPAAAAVPAPAPAAPSGDAPLAPQPSDPVPAAPPPAPKAGASPADTARAALAGKRASSPTQTSPEAAPAPAQDSATAAPNTPPPAPAPPTPGATLGARRGSAPAPNTSEPSQDAPQPDTPQPDAHAAQPAESEPPAAAAPAPPAPSSASAAGSGLTVDALTAAWDDVRAALPGRARSRFSGGRFIDVTGTGEVIFGLPNAIHRDRCQECVGDVADALSGRFGQQVVLTLVVDGDATPPPVRAADPAGAKPKPTTQDEAEVDLSALTDADPDAAGGMDLLAEAFPGAELVDPADLGDR